MGVLDRDARPPRVDRLESLHRLGDRADVLRAGAAAPANERRTQLDGAPGEPAEVCRRRGRQQDTALPAYERAGVWHHRERPGRLLQVLEDVECALRPRRAVDPRGQEVAAEQLAHGRRVLA